MKILGIVLLIFPFHYLGAQDEVVVIPDKKKETPEVKVFYSQKAINTKTVEVLRKGVLQFNVAHSFGDIGGSAGGSKTFFGLDNASDVRIGFQLGLSDQLNLVLARDRGAGAVRQQLEFGIKWQLIRQTANNEKPVSLSLFANDVVSMQPSSTLPISENYFEDFGKRHSQVVQVMVARKFGTVSVQLNPLYLHTNYVVANDMENIIALGAVVRLPLSKKIVILADYYHPFRSESSEDYFESQGVKFYDPFGIGLEILTEGHVFHLNFTNATDILENRFVRRTVTRWGDGQFRWAFNISRNFVLFRDKK